MSEFDGDERLLEEQRKVRDVVAQPISIEELNYVKHHPSLQEEAFPEYIFEYHRDYPPFRGAEEKHGKIVYDLD